MEIGRNKTFYMLFCKCKNCSLCAARQLSSFIKHFKGKILASTKLGDERSLSLFLLPLYAHDNGGAKAINILTHGFKTVSPCMMWRLRCQMLLLHGNVERTGCCRRAAGRNGAASIAPASQPDAIHAARRCMLQLCSGEGRQKTLVSMMSTGLKSK